jgi:hypothetical protein
MRVSEYYRLDLQQPSLDFVDVQVETDTRLFIDPTALNLLDTEWGARSRALIQDYFSLVLKLIKEGDHAKARQLLGRLNEPNETRLGYSANRPRGHGMGKKLAEQMWTALKDSTAVSSGLIQDLEDTALMIDGVASDVISDIVTNILREPLLEYTQAMCGEYGIPMQNIASRPLWSMGEHKWTNRMVDQPVIDSKPLLLVPKALVRKNITYDADDYYNLYLLERLQEEAVNEGFVRLLKNGKAKPPTKKSLKEKHGESGKEPVRRLTPEREDVLEKYRQEKQEKPREPLSHGSIAEATETSAPDWDGMLTRLDSILPGTEHAKQYEDIIKELFTAVFYPWLMYPTSQERIHEGRKIIDITYMNMAEDDFFSWLANQYPAQYIMVECKNYSEDPDNPALDQLSGRFSPRRGKFGMLVCRKIDNKERFTQKCRDTADDDRGFIIGLDDDDIRELAAVVRREDDESRLDILRDKFKKLVM